MERVAPVGNNPLGTFLPLILLVVVFYFLLIRPQRKRQQEQLSMQNSLAPGARVMTTTGLFGTVVGLQDEDVILEIAPGVETRWVKAAIGRVVTPVEDADDAEPDSAQSVAEEGVQKDAHEDIQKDKDEPVTETPEDGGAKDSSTKQS
ncbi:preprotein translocase subunit YajC [Microtetraspora sp. AC03309]|nr:preprotein translocase subunit YajC [Microtetraspora sp. AC03309]